MASAKARLTAPPRRTHPAKIERKKRYPALVTRANSRTRLPKSRIPTRSISDSQALCLRLSQIDKLLRPLQFEWRGVYA